MSGGVALAAVALTVFACRGTSAPAGPGSVSPPPATPYLSAHFSFSYTALDVGNIGAIAAAVETEYARIVQDLGTDALPRVNVSFYTDHAVLEAAAAAIAVPAWASGLATAQDQIHLMSPNLPAYAPFSRMVSNLVHEFAHCVSLHVNPRIANNPRWFWESVAVYESGQAVDPRSLPYMVAGPPPSFATLSTFDNTLVYDVGYTIAEFIVARGGKAALDDLVANNADVTATFGMTPPAFEAAWYAFVRQRYGI